MSLSEEDVLKILKLIDESDFDELNLEMEGLKLIVRKGGVTNAFQEFESPSILPPPSPSSKQAAPVAADIEASPITSPPKISIPPSGMDTPSLEGDGLLPIKAPLLGTFYRAPNLGAPPFVDVGAFVTENDTVCMIEVMKVFASVKAGVRGQVVKICAENAKLVEYQQTLFLIQPEKGPAEA